MFVKTNYIMEAIQNKVTKAEAKTLLEVEKVLTLGVDRNIKIDLIQSLLFEHRTIRGRILGSVNQVDKVS